jgi:hypothetical protein
MDELKISMQKEVDILQDKLNIVIEELKNKSKEKNQLSRLVSKKRKAMNNFFDDKIKPVKKYKKKEEKDDK